MVHRATFSSQTRAERGEAMASCWVLVTLRGSVQHDPGPNAAVHMESLTCR